MANKERLSRMNLFEGVVIGIYGNWLISFIDKISFEFAVYQGLYQSLCVGGSFATLLMLFAFSIFRPALVTRRTGFILALGHAVGNYGALWAEGWTTKLHTFYWIGTFLFAIIYFIELQRVAQAGQ